MPKRPEPFITRKQAEGTTIEKNAEKLDLDVEAKKLANKMPTDPAQRQLYVGNLLRQALAKQIRQDVFMRFVQMTNSYGEVEASSARARLIIGKGSQSNGRG